MLYILAIMVLDVSDIINISSCFLVFYLGLFMSFVVSKSLLFKSCIISIGFYV